MFWRLMWPREEPVAQGLLRVAGESVGQVSEKLRLVHLEETCHHYVAHVKVSCFSSNVDLCRCSFGTGGNFYSALRMRFQNFILQGGEHLFLLFLSGVGQLFIDLCWSSLRTALSVAFFFWEVSCPPSSMSSVVFSGEPQSTPLDRSGAYSHCT